MKPRTITQPRKVETRHGELMDRTGVPDSTVVLPWAAVSCEHAQAAFVRVHIRNTRWFVICTRLSQGWKVCGLFYQLPKRQELTIRPAGRRVGGPHTFILHTHYQVYITRLPVPAHLIFLLSFAELLCSPTLDLNCLRTFPPAPTSC